MVWNCAKHKKLTMPQPIKHLLLLSVLFPHLVFAEDRGNFALLEVIINGEDIGEYAVILESGDVMVPVAAFTKWRIKKKPIRIVQTDTVSLRSLAPTLQYKVDFDNANLKISTAPKNKTAATVITAEASPHKTSEIAANAPVTAVSETTPATTKTLAKKSSEKTGMEKVLLDVILNGEDLGTQVVNLRTNDVLVPTAVFKDWRIKQELWSPQFDGISLRSLAPHLQYTLDNNNAALTVVASEDSFEPQVLQTASSRYNLIVPDDAIHPAPWSGFVNYALNANFSQAQGFDSVNVPWEVGITKGRWFGFNNFISNYSTVNHSAKTIRNMSYLQWEDMKTRQKVTFGDFAVTSPTLSTSGNFGGILWQSNFRQYGQFDFMPSFDMNFNVATPSHAELYINQVKTKEWDLLPGTVSLPSLLTSGQGDATLVVTDAFGRQQQISQPFYVTQQLLKEGLHDFYYGAGAMRNFSNKMLDYGSTVLLGSHRYGFSDTLTAGGAFTLSKKVSNVGANVTHSFMGNSLIDTAVSMSHQDSLNGYLATASYQFNQDQLNFALNAGYMSQRYGNLYTDAASLQKNKYRLQTSVNYNIPYSGSSLGASFSQTASWNNNNKTSHAVSLFYRQSLLRNLSLNTQVSHDLGTGDNVASLMLSYFPQTADESDILHNNNLSYQANYDDKTHVDTQIWQAQKQGNIGEGYNYTAAFQKQDQKLSGRLRYQYKNNNGIYTANYAQNEQNIFGNIAVAGSLSTANNEFYFGRPITDSFAVVKVKGTEEDIPIYQDGAFLGVGNEDKAVVIPSLQSRRIAKMSIKPKDLGLGMISDRTEQTVAVGVRTASLMEFTLSKFVAVEGRAYTLAADGSKQYLEALPLEYKAKGKTQDSFIAKKGFFYLENVPTGEFKATVKRYKHDCILHLTIPKTDKVVAKLGDVQCTSD